MKTQRNHLFERIVERGLQPAEFQLDNDGEFTYVGHSPTESFFSITSADGIGYWGEAKVGNSGIYRYPQMEWPNLVGRRFTLWLYDVKLEAETPDMWEEFRKVGELVGRSQRESYVNTPFTASEQAQVSAQLKEIKKSLQKTYSLSGEQLAAIEARFDEAEEASHRIGRKDWQLLFLGVTIPIIFSALVPPDVIQHIIVAFFDALGHLFGGDVPPQLPPSA